MSENDKRQPDEPKSEKPELEEPFNSALESEAAPYADAEAAAAASDTFEQATDGLAGSEVEAADAAEEEGEAEIEPEPAGKLERIQKILAQSGIASRRHAEELITQGRVQVNGKVVTELGSKADPTKDHIRVDGKLLQGTERHRYFMLNKPKGYVTTVSDPEGRPTIMEFFSKTRERLYPVGRLDYLSEGLLLVTNDGELANKLTRAASGVEKTYLVKVSGQPTEEDLERLREGVSISKGKAGSGRVQTAPAQIRPFRPGKTGGQRGGPRSGDNPWFEVVLIEGRNRELRKMFEEIGHHVEKIRRVGYGPLVLDLEPGKIRELEPEEIENLHKAAEGKYRKPKVRESKREFKPRSERPGSKPRWDERRDESRSARGEGSRERRPFGGDRQAFGQRSETRGRRPDGERSRSEPRREFRSGSRPTPRPDSSYGEGRPQRSESRSDRPFARPSARFSEDRPQRPPRRDDQERRLYTGARENRGGSFKPQARDWGRGAKPARNKPERGSRPPQTDSNAGGNRGERPNRFQRTDRRAAGEFRSRRGGEPPQGFDRKPLTGSAGGFESRRRLEIEPIDKKPRSGEARFEGRNRPERPSFHARGGPRPGGGRPQGSGQRSRPGSQQGSRQQRAETPPERGRFDRDRQKPRFDRRRNEEGMSREGRSASDNRPPNQRSPGSRTGGGFRPDKRGGAGGKQGSVRSGGGRRPGSRPSGSGRSGSRPGGNRGGKRRP